MCAFGELFSGCPPASRVGGSAISSCLSLGAVQTQGIAAPLLVRWIGREFPGTEKDESERRVIQKATQSEQRAALWVNFLSFSVYLEILSRRHF